MKTLIFIRSSFLLTGLLFTVACQNAKLDKKSPQPAQPVSGQQYPQYPPNGGQRIPPTQGGQSAVQYPPPPTRSYPKESNAVVERPYKPLPEENRVGAAPVNRPRQKGAEPVLRKEPNIIPWFEKPGPYEKVVENCGQQCPPAVEKPICNKPDCQVEMVVDNSPAPTRVGEPVEMKVQAPNQPSPKVIKIDEPVEMGKAPRSREGTPELVECPPVDLKKREVTQELDVVFIVDNSDSMLVERQKIAEGMVQFAQNLGTDKDLRVAVVAANGPKGHGFAQVVGSVISGKDHSSLAEQLKHNMSNMPKDPSDAQGEVGLTATYGLISQASHLQQAKNQGLFREKAALMVVYVSDENDVCYDYEATGARPNYVYPGEDRGAQGAPGDGIGRDPYEARTFMANGVCKNVGRNGENMSPDLVYRALRNLKGAQPIILSGILYLREGHIPEATGPYKYEKEKGRGYLDLIERKDLNQGKAYDLADKDFGKHLANMARTAGVRMEYETDITMKFPAGADPAAVDPATIRVVVKNAQGTVLKEYRTECAIVGANCPANIAPAVYRRMDNGNGTVTSVVSIAPEVSSQLQSGSKAYIYYRTK